jgi:hypothetical protein
LIEQILRATAKDADEIAKLQCHSRDRFLGPPALFRRDPAEVHLAESDPTLDGGSGPRFEPPNFGRSPTSAFLFNE